MLNLSPELTKKAEDYISLANGIFLLLLAVSGNFVAETLGCKTQYALSNNMYLKNLVILFMIYFTINYSSTDVEHPLWALQGTVIIWIFFVLFSRMRPMYTLAVIILLLITYILNNFRKYYKATAPPPKDDKSVKMGQNKEEDNDKKQSALDKQLFELQAVSLGSASLLILVGSMMYLRDKKREYGNKFEILKFIFGVKKCASFN